MAFVPLSFIYNLKFKSMTKISILLTLCLCIGALNLSIAQQKIDTCQLIETKTDKFTQKTSHTFNGINVRIIKAYDKGEPYYTAILTLKSLIAAQVRGSMILLSNGELVTDTQATVSYNSLGNGQILVMAHIELSSLDIPSMLKYEITDFRLGGLDAKVTDGQSLKAGLKCLLEKK
jgi:hypothetical protein